MNRKQFLLLIVIVCILGGLGIAVYQRNSATWEEKAAPSGKILGDFDLNAVARVVIRDGNNTLNLVRENEVWTVVERDNYPADFQRIRNFIQTLWLLKPAQEVDADPSLLSRLNLVNPAQGSSNSGTLVEFQNKEAKPIASLLIGKRYFKKAPEAPNEQGYPIGCYVMPVGVTAPKVSLVPERLEVITPNPVIWLDKTFLKIDKIQSIAVVSGSMQWKVNRDSETSSDWKLVDLKPQEEMEPKQVPAIAVIFGDPVFYDVLPADTKREGFDATATVETFDGLVYTLKFGTPDRESIPMTIAITAQERKDEKPEEKKQREETLAKVKALESRIYVVSKKAFEDLWKPRADLLKKDPELPPVPAALQKDKPTPTLKK